MADIVFIKDNPLYEFFSRSIEMGAFEIEVENRDGYEEITLQKNEVGFGLARLDADSEEAQSLRDQLYSLEGKKRGTMKISGTEYHLKVSIYQSFGEDVYRLQIEKTGH